MLYLEAVNIVIKVRYKKNHENNQIINLFSKETLGLDTTLSS